MLALGPGGAELGAEGPILPDFYQPGTQRFLCTAELGAVSLAGLDLVPLCVTFLFCFWEVQYGIVAGVLVSGILLLYSIARPPMQVGCSPRVGALGLARSGELPVAHPGGLVQVSGQVTLLVQPGSSLHFPAIEHLRDVICSRALSGTVPPATNMSWGLGWALVPTQSTSGGGKHGLSPAGCGCKQALTGFPAAGTPEVVSALPAMCGSLGMGPVVAWLRSNAASGCLIRRAESCPKSCIPHAC